jgi:hypothetical protein
LTLNSIDMSDPPDAPSADGNAWPACVHGAPIRSPNLTAFLEWFNDGDAGTVTLAK